MKKVALLLLLVALAISASAQATLDFSDLPDARTPTPMPNGYGNLNWSSVSYVNPFEWSGAGQAYNRYRYRSASDEAALTTETNPAVAGHESWAPSHNAPAQYHASSKPGTLRNVEEASRTADGFVSSTMPTTVGPYCQGVRVRR